MISTRFCIVGAGFSGAVIARSLADAGFRVLVIDERNHIAGNCHTDRDSETGIMTHVYGPHIFHTADESVWSFVNKFATMMPYAHRVRAISMGKVYSLPVNLLTINQFFNRTFSPREAEAFIKSQAASISDPANFEEQALSMIGEGLYRAFFRGYTRKQWGTDPTQLPASILKRLPLRFDYNDSYFSHPYQAIPKDGYSSLVSNILKSENIEVRLDCLFEDQAETFEHVFYTGPIDRFFNYKLGRLGYRTLDFKVSRETGDFQGTAVMNYCDEDTPFTRITEHKHFSPWETHHKATICYTEFSRECQEGDIPYYPIRLAAEQAMLRNYIELAKSASGVSFLGRLGTYRYIDMDQTIAEALAASQHILTSIRHGEAIPAFFIDPH